MRFSWEVSFPIDYPAVESRFCAEAVRGRRRILWRPKVGIILNFINNGWIETEIKLNQLHFGVNFLETVRNHKYD